MPSSARDTAEGCVSARSFRVEVSPSKLKRSTQEHASGNDMYEHTLACKSYKEHPSTNREENNDSRMTHQRKFTCQHTCQVLQSLDSVRPKEMHNNRGWTKTLRGPSKPNTTKKRGNKKRRRKKNKPIMLPHTAMSCIPVRISASASDIDRPS